MLGTYFFTHELTDDRRLALVSATLMLASPILIIQSGVYLGYLFSLGLGLFFGATLLASLRRRTRWLALASGVFLGGILLTRPFDALLWGVPLFGYATIVCWRKWQPLRRAIVWSAIGFLPFLAFTFFYNHRISGSFTEFPITTKNSRDSFGFGPRQLMPIGKVYDYTVGHAFDGLTDNLLALPPFLVGSWLGVVAVLFGIWLRRRDRSTIALLGIAIRVSVGLLLLLGELALESHRDRVGTRLLRAAVLGGMHLSGHRAHRRVATPPEHRDRARCGARGDDGSLCRIEDRSQPQDRARRRNRGSTPPTRSIATRS